MIDYYLEMGNLDYKQDIKFDSDILHNFKLFNYIQYKMGLKKIYYYNNLNENIKNYM